MSWAAIAQIESGRRRDPRMSTLIALAEALGVSVDQLAGRPPDAGAPVTLLEHRALLYASDNEFTAATVPFLKAGIERSDALLAVTSEPRIDKMRRALGRDSRLVQFLPATDWYTSPEAALDAIRSFLQDSVRGGSAWVRIIGEPVWANRSASEIRAWTQYEATVNTSFATAPMSILCPYNTRSVSARIATAARCTHPEVDVGSGPVASPDYRS